MKKWFGTLGVMLILAGCQNSTSDVAVVENERVVAEPDTIIVSDSLSIEMYRPDNPRAIEVDAQLQASEGVRMGLELLAEEGFRSEGSGTFYTRAIAFDGKVLEATWFPVSDPAQGRFALLGHVRTDEGEFVMPLRDLTRVGGGLSEADILVPGDKGEWRPSRAFTFGGCTSFYQALFEACYSICRNSGVSHRACINSCIFAAVAGVVACIFFTVIGGY